MWYDTGQIGMLPIAQPDPNSNVPMYRQLSDSIRELIKSGRLERGGRLPATRELAGWLGLNRTTVSAAYDLLESEGLIAGQVGRGSFVAGAGQCGVEWEDILPQASHGAVARDVEISFASARPSELLFPIEEFREACAEVIRSDEAQNILQLGSPAGYAPLRRYLLQRAR